VRAWGSGRWTAPAADAGAPHEAKLLRLDSSKARERLAWRPVYGVEEAVAKTVEWHRAASKPGFDALAFTRAQLADYAAAAGRPAAGANS